MRVLTVPASCLMTVSRNLTSSSAPTAVFGGMMGKVGLDVWMWIGVVVEKEYMSRTPMLSETGKGGWYLWSEVVKRVGKIGQA